MTCLGRLAARCCPGTHWPRGIRGILEAIPARGGWGPARIAASAGVDLDTVLSGLGELAAGGFVERCERGWPLRRPGE